MDKIVRITEGYVEESERTTILGQAGPSSKIQHMKRQQVHQLTYAIVLVV